MYCLRKLRSFGAKSDMSVTFYSVVICSLIWLVLSVGMGIFQNFITRGWKRLWKKSRSCCWEAIWQFWDNLWKRSCKKKQKNLCKYWMILHTQWDTTLIAATGVEDFYLLKQIQTIIKPRFHPVLCKFLMKIITVIYSVRACVRTSAEDDDFQRANGFV